MSLLDALLLEEPTPAKTPTEREIFITVRNDGHAGSGTASDPFNGSTAYETGISGTFVWNPPTDALARAGVVTVTTDVPHGYTTAEAVEISGITGSGAEFFNGRFALTVLSSASFQYMIIHPQLETSRTGALRCSKLTHRFDQIMRALSPYTTVRLGPGTIETRGFSEFVGTVGWPARTGTKLIGAGVGVTILKVVLAMDDALAGAGAVGHDIKLAINSFEALTSRLMLTCAPSVINKS